MGQFFILVNTTKKQIADGVGGKFLEIWGSELLAQYMAILMSTGNGNGLGDLHAVHPLLGSWAGDRVSLLGEYAEFDGVDRDGVDDTWTNIGESLNSVIKAEEEYQANRGAVDAFLEEKFGDRNVWRIPTAQAKQVFRLTSEHIDDFTREEENRAGERTVAALAAVTAAIQVHGSWAQFRAPRRQRTPAAEAERQRRRRVRSLPRRHPAIAQINQKTREAANAIAVLMRAAGGKESILGDRLDPMVRLLRGAVRSNTVTQELLEGILGSFEERNLGRLFSQSRDKLDNVRRLLGSAIAMFKRRDMHPNFEQALEKIRQAADLSFSILSNGNSTKVFTEENADSFENVIRGLYSVIESRNLDLLDQTVALIPLIPRGMSSNPVWARTLELRTLISQAQQLLLVDPGAPPGPKRQRLEQLVSAAYELSLKDP